MKTGSILTVVSVLMVGVVLTAYGQCASRANQAGAADGRFQLAACGSTGCAVPHKAASDMKACPPGCEKPCCSDKSAAKKECSTESGVCAVKRGCGSESAKACGPKGARCHGKKGASAAEAEITTAGLAALLNSKVPLVLLDARSGKYDDGRRIPGAGSLSAASSEEQIAEAVPDKDALVVTYCSNLKCPASAALAERLRALGYSNVIEYPEGIQGWADDGREVVEPDA